MGGEAPDTRSRAARLSRGRTGVRRGIGAEGAERECAAAETPPRAFAERRSGGAAGAGAQCLRTATVVSSPFDSSITQRTDREHGQLPPTRFSLGMAFTAWSRVISPAATLRRQSA